MIAACPPAGTPASAGRPSSSHGRWIPAAPCARPEGRAYASELALRSKLAWDTPRRTAQIGIACGRSAAARTARSAVRREDRRRSRARRKSDRVRDRRRSSRRHARLRRAPEHLTQTMRSLRVNHLTPTSSQPARAEEHVKNDAISSRHGSPARTTRGRASTFTHCSEEGCLPPDVQAGMGHTETHGANRDRLRQFSGCSGRAKRGPAGGSATITSPTEIGSGS